MATKSAMNWREGKKLSVYVPAWIDRWLSSQAERPGIGKKSKNALIVELLEEVLIARGVRKKRA